jgi:hypothetical protein
MRPKPLTAEIRSEPPAARTYTTKHGTTSTMTVTNIGAKPAALTVAEPAAAPVEWSQTDIEDVAPTPQPLEAVCRCAARSWSGL